MTLFGHINIWFDRNTYELKIKNGLWKNNLRKSGWQVFNSMYKIFNQAKIGKSREVMTGCVNP